MTQPLWVIATSLDGADCATPGRALYRVRHALVAFFAKQPVGERRAEELPWLLERLQNWTALKTVVLDLSMFELLWSDRLKDDLLRYWSVLSGAFRCAITRRTGDVSPLLVYRLACVRCSDHGRLCARHCGCCRG